jgi:hypothetical protein
LDSTLSLLAGIDLLTGKRTRREMILERSTVCSKSSHAIIVQAFARSSVVMM